MLTSSAQYRAALPYAVRREVRVQVLHNGAVVADSDLDDVYLPLGGNVEAQLQARVTRTARLAIDPSLYPVTSTDVFAPEIAVLRLYGGIGYPDGSREVFPIFTGRVIKVDRDPAGMVTVSAEDYASDVVAFQFEQPQLSITTNTVTAEIKRLIRQVLPDAVFGTNNVTDGLVPALVWDTDRGQALDDLASSLGARWYTLGDGSFVVRAYPYTVGTPVASLVDESGGTLMTATTTRTREGVVNSWTVVSERMDGTAPVRATVRDLDSASPTMYGSTFGVISKVIKVQTPLTSGQAQQTAAALLSTTRALGEQWSVNCVPDYTLEAGDTIDLSYRGLSGTQVIDRITYPLMAADNMQMTTRSSVSPSQQGG